LDIGQKEQGNIHSISPHRRAVANTVPVSDAAKDCVSSAFLLLCARGEWIFWGNVRSVRRKYADIFRSRGPRIWRAVVPGVDFTWLSVLPAEGTVVALSVCGSRNRTTAISSKAIGPYRGSSVRGGDGSEHIKVINDCF